MAPARLLVALLAALLLTSSANAAPRRRRPDRRASARSSSGADEPLRHEYSRTPAFAWAPVRGAQRYEFELATSSTFRENGIIYSDSELKSPVASLTLTLPWITGSPYSLYARVRAIVAGGATTWSKPFGFNMRQADVPRPLSSFPGLLRWTPVEGSQAYDVWLIDIPKIVRIRGNVMDQREFWTFPPVRSVDGQGPLAHPHRALGHVERREVTPERAARNVVRPVEPRLRVREPPVRGRLAQRTCDGFRRRDEGPLVRSGASPDARIRLLGQPRVRRRRRRALSRVRLHRPRLRQPRLHRRGDGRAGVCAALVRDRRRCRRTLRRSRSRAART
jgi:hypothetical protein